MIEQKKHIGWVDMLRIIACFFVVVSHCSDPCFVAADRADFLEGWSVGSLVRCCVPLFVMISGVLLLPTSMSLGEFYSKRLKRLAVPLVFWSVLLPFLFYFYQNLSGGCTFPLMDGSAYTLKDTVYKSLTFFLNFNYDTTPLWYLYMLVGLYLIIPILSAWVKSASQKEIRIFLIVWGVSLFVPYIELAAKVAGFVAYPGSSDVFGVCDWNVFGTFYYVSGFVGYLLLGYYLKTYPIQWNWKKCLSICVPMFAVGVFATFISLVLLMKHIPSQMSFSWLFCTANVFCITFPVFAVMQKMDVAPSPFLSKVASTTFGIYLSHFFFIHVGYDFFQAILPEGTPLIILILCNSLAAFAVCYLLVSTMLRFRLTRRLVA